MQMTSESDRFFYPSQASLSWAWDLRIATVNPWDVSHILYGIPRAALITFHEPTFITAIFILSGCSNQKVKSHLKHVSLFRLRCIIITNSWKLYFLKFPLFQSGFAPFSSLTLTVAMVSWWAFVCSFTLAHAIPQLWPLRISEGSVDICPRNMWYSPSQRVYVFPSTWGKRTKSKFLDRPQKAIYIPSPLGVSSDPLPVLRRNQDDHHKPQVVSPLHSLLLSAWSMLHISLIFFFYPTPSPIHTDSPSTQGGMPGEWTREEMAQ